MRCNESTIYIYPQFKRQYFLQTIENSNLLTNFTTDFTNLSLKLKLVIDSDAKEFHFVLNRDNGSFTGQHRISLDPFKSNCLIFWMISFHLIGFILLINLFQIGIYGMFNLVDIFRRLKQLSHYSWWVLKPSPRVVYWICHVFGITWQQSSYHAVAFGIVSLVQISCYRQNIGASE